MNKVKAVSSKPTEKKRRPALTPETRENQLISLAVDLAEKQLMEGTASSQIIAHFLKLGTTTAALEKEKLKNENLLLEAKTKSIKDAADMKELYADAIAAMKRYSGHGDDDY